jgi:FAD/FMN-containing dehydrogenase
MSREWTNWSGSLRFSPSGVETPENEKELRALLVQAAEDGRSVRVVGAGYSFAPLVATDHLLVSLERFQSLVSHDEHKNEVTVRPGITLKEACTIFHDLGLSMANLGDTLQQSLAGAMSVGTHGTGKDLHILSSHLVGGRMVTGGGPMAAFDIEDDPELINMLRVSLGTIGIFTELRLRLIPAYELERKEWSAHIEACLDHLDELIQGNRHFDFHWRPHGDETTLRTLNPLGQGLRNLPFATLLSETCGPSHEVIPSPQEPRFEEMEYFLPREAGPECFRKVRRRITERWGNGAVQRVLYRTVAADDCNLSPATDRNSATISLRHQAGVPYQEFFSDMEPVFLDHGGRPHWAKHHSLRAERLRPMYPGWDEFLRMRKCLDPDGVLLNPYLRELLGV